MSLRQTPDGPVFNLCGDLDIATAQDFEIEFARSLALIEDGRVIVDMAGLGSLDGSGIHALTRAAERAERHHVSVVVRNFLAHQLPQKDREVFDIFELLSMLNVQIPSSAPR